MWLIETSGVWLVGEIMALTNGVEGTICDAIAAWLFDLVVKSGGGFGIRSDRMVCTLNGAARYHCISKNILFLGTCA